MTRLWPDGFTVTETPTELMPWQDVTAGDETVYSSTEMVRTEPFIERDIRLAVERLRREERASRPIDPPRVLDWDGDLRANST